MSQMLVYFSLVLAESAGPDADPFVRRAATVTLIIMAIIFSISWVRQVASQKNGSLTARQSAQPVTTTHSDTERPRIFVSYRRSDSSHVTGRIYDRLIQEFGRDAVFKDVDSIPFGVDFRQHLDAMVGTVSVLLVVIGDTWVDARDENNQVRLSDARDFVRIEIESALRLKIPVVPVLVRGAVVPNESQLPESLRELVYRNGLSIRPDPDFHRDVDRLIQAMGKYLSGATHLNGEQSS